MEPLKFHGTLTQYLYIYDVLISTRRKYLGHHNEILGILGEVPMTLPIGHVEENIISGIGGKGEFVISLDGMHRIPCLFSSVT